MGNCCRGLGWAGGPCHLTCPTTTSAPGVLVGVPVGALVGVWVGVPVGVLVGVLVGVNVGVLVKVAVCVDVPAGVLTVA